MESGEPDLELKEDNCTVILSNKTAIAVLAVFVPSDSKYWEERTDSWYAFFYLLIIIYSVLFLAFAITCIVLLSRRHLAQRFKVRTFIAIDIALIVLGCSRFLFLVLDPWRQLGFCTHYACTVISRLLGALGFPSLTASYTLVFITLWLSARIHLGRSCVQKLKILIPLCCIHYVVALAVEIVLLTPFSESVGVLILLVSCEAVFSIWGFTVCLLFLVAGFRLLKTLQKTAKKSSVICRDSPNVNRHDLIDKSRFTSKNFENLRTFSLSTMKLKAAAISHQNRALRKVTLITYITMALGITYSVLGLANLFFVIFSLFDGCPGEIQGGKMLPELWLLLQYIFFSIEICMAVLLTYAINDYAPLIAAFKGMILKCCADGKLTVFQFSPTVEDIPSRGAQSSSQEFGMNSKANGNGSTLTRPESPDSLSTDIKYPEPNPSRDGYLTPKDHSIAFSRTPSPLTVPFSPVT